MGHLTSPPQDCQGRQRHARSQSVTPGHRTAHVGKRLAGLLTPAHAPRLHCTASDVNVAIPGSHYDPCSHDACFHPFIANILCQHMCICKMCLRCAGLVEDVEKPLRGKDTGQAPGVGMRGAAGIRLPWPRPRGLADTKESEPFTRIHLESGSNFGIRNGWSIGYIFCIKKN